MSLVEKLHCGIKSIIGGRASHCKSEEDNRLAIGSLCRVDCDIHPYWCLPDVRYGEDKGCTSLLGFAEMVISGRLPDPEYLIQPALPGTFGLDGVDVGQLGLSDIDRADASVGNEGSKVPESIQEDLPNVGVSGVGGCPLGLPPVHGETIVLELE